MAEMIGFEACFGLRWNWNGILLGSSPNLDGFLCRLQCGGGLAVLSVWRWEQ